MDFIGSVRAQLHAHGMAQKGSRLLAAVSGGPDSMAMLHALQRLGRGMGFSLIVAHVDHGLRPTSRRDLLFVKREARTRGLPFFARTIAVKAEAQRLGRSIEDAARRLRYEALYDMAREHGCGRIATGHTASDQAETVLMRVIAGTGLNGLAGILPVRAIGADGGLSVIRPLLAVTRVEVEAFVKKETLACVVDESNADPRFDRNRVRASLLPLIEREFNPSAVRALARLAENAREESAALDRLAADAVAQTVVFAKDGRARINRAALNDLPGAIRARVLDHALRRTAPGARFDRTHLAALNEKIGRGTGTSHLSLPGGVRATVAYDEVTLAAGKGGAARAGGEEGHGPVTIPGPGVYDIPWLGGARLVFGRGPRGLFNASFDMRVCRYPFTVRAFRPGDRVGPPLHRHTKKVQDIFVDAKVPRQARGMIPLLCTGDGKTVLWVISRTHPRPATDPKMAIFVSLDIPADSLPEVVG